MMFSTTLLLQVQIVVSLVVIGIGICSSAVPDNTPRDSDSIIITPDYGFPRCYTSFVEYDTAFVDNTRPNNEERPLVGQERYPYDDGSTTSEDCNALPLPLVALGPHWSAIGLTRYQYNGDDISSCTHCLPVEFQNTLIVASHGSWNRSPFIGYSVQSYDVDFSNPHDYKVTNQRTLLPSLRHANTGVRIRPVDVRVVSDGTLLMTADRDDVSTTSRGGGLYRIRRASSNNTTSTSLLASVNTLGENPANVVLEQIVDIPCARQITVSTDNPRLVYVSTLGSFCPVRSGGNRIWVVELDANNSGVATRKSVLVEGLLEPQGIDWYGGSLYIATSGRSFTNQGNCVLEIKDVDKLLSTSSSLPLISSTTAVVAETVVCGFTMTQNQHHWRSLRVHPSGIYAIVSVGAQCNWPCTDGARGTNDYQTTLLRVDLTTNTNNRGKVAVAAKGIRNAIGLWFDPNHHLLFTSFGSDQAAGIPGATSANNVPDCTLEVLRLSTEEGLTTTLPPTTTTLPPTLCFSGRNTVELMGRGLVRMDTLSIGDYVRVQGGKFSKVYSFGHYNTNKPAEYLQLFFSSDDAIRKKKGSSTPLEMSEDHMVFVVTLRDDGDKKSTTTVVPASELKVGDTLLLGVTDADTTTTTTATVYKIVRNVKRNGAYAPFTVSGDIVVSGVLASNYVSMMMDDTVPMMMQHDLAHAFTFPHRFLCSLDFTTICENEAYTNNGLSNWIHHPYYLVRWMIRHQNSITLVATIFSFVAISTLILQVGVVLRVRFTSPSTYKKRG